MNIVMVTNEYPPNVRAGLGRYAERVAAHLVGDGHRLWVVAANDGDDPVTGGDEQCRTYRPVRRWMRPLLRSKALRRNRITDIAVISLNVLLYSIDTFALVRRLARRERIDVVAVHDTTSGPLSGILLSAFTDLPVVFHVHSTETTMTPYGVVKDPLGVIARLERNLARRADRVIVLSPEQRDLMRRHGWPPASLAVVPHGHDRPVLAGVGPPDALEIARLRRELDLPPAGPVLVFTGRLVPAKGIDVLLGAMPAVLRHHPDAVLVVLGAGKGRGPDPAFTAALARLGIGHAVRAEHRFVEARDVYRYTRAADVAVYPSRYEPFGLVALEAMALGRPVVLGPGFSAMFYGEDRCRPAVDRLTRADPAGLAEAVLALLDDPDRRAELGRRAVEVAAAFTWKRAVDDTVRVYESAQTEAVARR